MSRPATLGVALSAALGPLLLVACGTSTGSIAASSSGSAADPTSAPATTGATPATSGPGPAEAAPTSASPARASAAASASPGRSTSGTTRSPAPRASSTATRPAPSRTSATPAPSPTRSSTPTGPRLSVTPTRGLDSDGATIRVTGRGYDPTVGIYVAMCTSAAPTSGSSCVGGADLSGTSGASAWISSDPPPYGENLAIPFGPGGSFSVTLTVRATGHGLDCTVVRCGVITRADHTRYGTRSQDAFVALRFA